MPRRKIIPDSAVFEAVSQLLATGGERAVAFSAVARMTGLAPPTLVQRYGTRDGMLGQALARLWDGLDAAATSAILAADGKGAQGLLKGLDGAEASPGLALLMATQGVPALRTRCADFRQRIEAALATRLGGGEKGQQAAAILFAAWQGQCLWRPHGGAGFRLKDAVKRLD